ncbi:MAG: HlyC/CorC family transporter [Chloroflexi bacterium]|nr:HlyC/CorC family transporter [Chloroflexota bacterium]
MTELDSESSLGLAVSVICLVLLSFISLAEAALASVPRERVDGLVERGEPGARSLARLLQKPSVLFSTLTIAKTLTIIGFSSLGTALALAFLSPNRGAIAGVVVGIVLVLAVVQTGLPALIRHANPERAALMSAGAMGVLLFVLAPVVALFRAFANLLLLPFGHKETVAQEEEILQLAAFEGEEEPIIEEEERRMIRGIFELDKTAAHEVMVPRIDIVAADAAEPLAHVADLIVTHGYSRIPVYEGTIDNIVGIIYAKDLLGQLRNGGKAPRLRQIAREPYIIPETKRLDELLREFQEKRVHMAIVVDEYGGTAGLVTIEDILEEIVGEIADEHERGEERIRVLSQNEGIVDGRVSIDDLTRATGLHVAEGDFDTVGGFLYTQLGKVPAPGDQIETDGYTISVLSTIGRRVQKVKVIKRPPEEEANGGNH